MTEFSSKLPVWYQLAMLLRAEILNGGRPAGSQIEPEVPFAARHGVSVMPVRQALRTLEAEGLISRQRGRGTFVLPPRQPGTGSTSLEALYAQEFDRPARIEQRGRISPPPFLRDDFPDDRELSFMTRLAFRDGQPWSYGTLYHLPEFDPHLSTAMLQDYPLYRMMEEHCGIRLVRSKFRARAAAAMPQVAERLEIDPFSPVLNLIAVSYDPAGRAVGAFRMDFIADPYVFEFETLHGGTA